MPEDDIRRRFYRSRANFWHIYREIADLWIAYYNAGSDLIEVAFGTSGEFAISDEDLFRRLLEFAGNADHG